MIRFATAGVIAVAFVVCFRSPSIYAETIILENAGATDTTGDNLDGLTPGALPANATVEEIAGLQLTVTAIASSGTNPTLNSLLNSLGIDVDEGDDSDQFDDAFGESTTWEFNKAVNITQLDFVGFETGEVFSFGGTTINFGDLTNASTDIFDFSGGGFDLPANTPFTLTATTGTIGIEAITLTVAVPEPRSFVLGLGSLLAFVLFGLRRRNGKFA